MGWDLLMEGKKSASENMRLDAERLERLLPTDAPCWRVYEWSEDAVSAGSFVSLHRHLDQERWKASGAVGVKRPTAGGIVLHSWSLTFSFFLPQASACSDDTTLYRWVHSIMGEFLSQFIDDPLSLAEEASCDPLFPRFCMAHIAPQDLLWKGKKIVGSAQKKSRHGSLVQGFLILGLPSKEYLENIGAPLALFDEIRNHAAPLFANLARDAVEERRFMVKKALVRFLLETKRCYPHMK